VVKRLFHWTLEPSARAGRAPRAGAADRPAAAPARAAASAPHRALPALAPPSPIAAAEPPRGFLARRRAEKEARKVRREAARKPR
jgi:tRNA pseudouridine13 synthase